MNDSIINTQALSNAQATPTLGKTSDLQKARETAQDFEAFFLGQMLKPMFDSIDAEPPFGGGSAEEMWRSLQVDEYGKAIAKSGGVGLADAVVAEILKTQEMQ